MISPRKLLVTIAFSLAVAGFASASDIYFAQNAQGANNGQDCADAYAYNDGSHGINKSANWVAGNTLHVCGTITVNAGQNIISAQGSGSSGNPITIKFEQGAILQAPYFGTGSSAGIYLSGHNYITVNGGNSGKATGGTAWTGGLIQNYANGSAGQKNCPGLSNTYTGACTYQQNPTTVIEAIGSNNLTIQNLGPCIVAVVTNAQFSNGAPGADCIHFQGSNVTITNNQLYWDGLGIDNTYYGNDTNTVISNNDFQENGWGLGCAGANVSNTNYQVFNNHFHNFDGWTGTGAHVNGIHCYDGSGGGIQQFYLYNNLFDGNMGTCCWTAWVYLEANGPGNNWNGSTGTLYAFNNIFFSPQVCCDSGNGLLNYGGPSSKGHMVVNNYFFGTPAQAGACIDFTGSGPGQTIENNVFQNCGQVITGSTFQGNPAPGWDVWDYNIYANISSGNPAWSVSSIKTNSFSTWQSACGCDTHSQAQLSSLLADITSEGVPSSGYIGIQQGANLSAMAVGNMTALAYDTGAGNSHTPTQRPNGNWDIGSYEYASSSSIPQPPTGLSALVQ